MRDKRFFWCIIDIGGIIRMAVKFKTEIDGGIFLDTVMEYTESF